jgi:Tfp pilus assembly protein PilN
VSNQTLVRVAIGVLLLVGLIYGAQVMGSRELEAEIASLEKQVTKQRAEFFGAKAKTDGPLPSTAKVDSWQKERVQWLDQLHELSPLIGESDDLILTEVHMSHDVKRGLGRITVTGLTNDPRPVTRMTSQIRDHKNYNVPTSKLDQNRDRQAEYRWRFSKLNILLEKKAPLPKTKAVNEPDQSDTGDEAKAGQADTGKVGS